jgi:hypothetical protein
MQRLLVLLSFQQLLKYCRVLYGSPQACRASSEGETKENDDEGKGGSFEKEGDEWDRSVKWLYGHTPGLDEGQAKFVKSRMSLTHKTKIRTKNATL